MSSKKPVSKRLKRQVKNQIEKYIEKKTAVYEYFGGIQDSARNPLDDHVTALAQGTGQNQRVGNRVNITSLKYDLFFTGADATNSIRVIFYIPKDPSVLMGTPAGIPFNKAPDMDNFNILRDMLVSTSSSGQNCVRRQGWLRFNRGNRSGHKERYDGALVSNRVQGHIYVYMVSDSLAVSDPQCNGYIRTFFTDS